MSFALDLRKLCDAAKEKGDQVVRKVMFDLATAVVMRSPVGDPEFWIYNRGDSESPDYVDFLTYRSPPAGYVGGRFRANWQYGFGAPDETTTEVTDADGSGTIQGIVAQFPEKMGGVHYLSNSLPYAIPLEEGHSHRQAPAGIVGITVLEFQPYVADAARSLAG